MPRPLSKKPVLGIISVAQVPSPVLLMVRVMVAELRLGIKSYEKTRHDTTLHCSIILTAPSRGGTQDRSPGSTLHAQIGLWFHYQYNVWFSLGSLFVLGFRLGFRLWHG